ncbi:MAG: MBL fold metallo-hydrolase [Pararhodobacter sp.]|nr:MBL fold metallo-hydrolase [Pararhodobacter sp.]
MNADHAASSPGFDPRPGKPLSLAPGVRLVLAPNPSPMTERGTNTYLLGEGHVTVLDPGPDLPVHLAAITAALAPGERIARILVSHSHVDHAPAARPLALATGAPVLAFGDAEAGRSERMKRLVGQGIGGGEGVDAAFRPDATLADGDDLDIGGATLRILHTPGHLGNHLSFLWGQALFCGDTVMGWAPSLVSPPDGDLTDFMRSLDRLEALGQTRLYPGHGGPVDDGPARIRALRSHRLGREAAIRNAIAAGAGDAQAIVQRVYTDVPVALLPGALRNVLAHLIDLEGRGLVAFDGLPGPDTPLHATG